MGEKRFVCIDVGYGDDWYITDNGKRLSEMEIVDKLNEQQELIEELQVSDEMGWKRAERFEKKCPKEFHNKKMYIKRLEYKVQKFKEENEQLRKIGVMYQGHNPCETCTYCLEDKVCCAEPVLICDNAKKDFIQGLCKKHKQFQKSNRRYDDE